MNSIKELLLLGFIFMTDRVRARVDKDGVVFGISSVCQS